MKTRRNIFKIIAGTIASLGAGSAIHAKQYVAQPILQDILQTQTIDGPVGLSILLRFTENIPTFEKVNIETKGIKNFIEFDRTEFRKILKKAANKRSHEYTPLITMYNRVAIYSHRGAANIFVIHPEDQKYVEQHLKEMHIYGIKILMHPDVPKDYALAVYKGLDMWDGAGVFCPMKGYENSRAGVWTHDLDKYMYLGRYK